MKYYCNPRFSFPVIRNVIYGLCINTHFSGALWPKNILKYVWFLWNHGWCKKLLKSIYLYNLKEIKWFLHMIWPFICLYSKLPKSGVHCVSNVFCTTMLVGAGHAPYLGMTLRAPTNRKNGHLPIPLPPYKSLYFTYTGNGLYGEN